ncbi:MAG: cation/H(+) antiporter [Verrucomicrobia bacterium]|nr:cation/H(+) antiporter [Verrucomicrobiota bacterium]
MNNFSFLQDLAVVMVAAGIAALVCQWLRQPRVLGFIIAGLIIGPHAHFTFISDNESIMTLGDIGLVFLMFSLGLEFNLRRLMSVGSTTFITALVDVGFMFWLGFVIGRFMGWNTMESVFLGAIICDSSTTVITRILQELGQSRERFAGIVIGATIVEDLIAIVLITLLTGMAISGQVQPDEVMFRVGKLVTFLVAVLLSGVVIFRRVIDYVAKWKSDELLLITVLALCFSVSLVAAKMQFSLALGAFVVGAVIAESRAAERISAFIEPVRNTFGPMFFVAMGMLIDPQVVVHYILPILLLIAAIMIGKVVAGSVGAFLSGNDRETSFRVGCGLAQICEFAIIFAALGRTLKVTSDHVYSIAVSAAVGTIFLNPHLMRYSGRLMHAIDAVVPNSFTGNLSVYTKWYRNAFRGPGNPTIRAIVRRTVVTMIVNICLITAIFVTATVLSKTLPALVSIPEVLGGPPALYWLAGALLCIPLYVANIRKLGAMSMLAAEMKFPIDSTRPHAAIARALTEKVVFFAGIAALGIFTLMLSSALLPPSLSLIILLFVIAIITAVFWKFQIRLYGKVRLLLRDAFADQSQGTSDRPIPNHSGGTHLISVPVEESSRAASRTISQLDIQASTGASIIGIERDGQTIVNPAGDEIVRPGDKILVLGHKDEAERASELLAERAG